MTADERKAAIAALVKHWEGMIFGNPMGSIDYGAIASSISAEVGAPVVVFPAPTDHAGGFKLVAYEVPGTEESVQRLRELERKLGVELEQARIQRIFG